MTIAPRFALFALLAGPTVPAFAQVQGYEPGPIARAVEQAGRLAAPTSSSSTVATPALDQARPGLSDWSRVSTLDPGREIILTRAGPQRRRLLLKADEVGLAILNVDDPAIPAAVTSVLVSTARKHPDYFTNAQRGGRFVLGEGVRLGPDGVFQDDRRLFDIAHVIESVSRDDVVEVSILTKHIGRHVWRGALIGAGAGAVGGAITAANCRPGGEPGYCNVAGMAAWGAVLGAGFGLEFGAIIGVVAPRSPSVIYRR